MVACTYISVDRDSRTILAADCVNGTRWELNVACKLSAIYDIGLFVALQRKFAFIMHEGRVVFSK
jgi:hypothetical protein